MCQEAQFDVVHPLNEPQQTCDVVLPLTQRLKDALESHLQLILNIFHALLAVLLVI